MQYGSPNDLDAAGNDPFIEAMDLGIVTLQPRGPAPESVLMDITMDPGTIGADASTPSKDSLIGSAPRMVPDRIRLVLICQPRCLVSRRCGQDLSREPTYLTCSRLT